MWINRWMRGLTKRAIEGGKRRSATLQNDKAMYDKGFTFSEIIVSVVALSLISSIGFGLTARIAQSDAGQSLARRVSEVTRDILSPAKGTDCAHEYQLFEVGGMPTKPPSSCWDFRSNDTMCVPVSLDASNFGNASEYVKLDVWLLPPNVTQDCGKDGSGDEARDAGVGRALGICILDQYQEIGDSTNGNLTIIPVRIVLAYMAYVDCDNPGALTPRSSRSLFGVSQPHKCMYQYQISGGVNAPSNGAPWSFGQLEVRRQVKLADKAQDTFVLALSPHQAQSPPQGVTLTKLTGRCQSP